MGDRQIGMSSAVMWTLNWSTHLVRRLKSFISVLELERAIWGRNIEILQRWSTNMLRNK